MHTMFSFLIAASLVQAAIHVIPDLQEGRGQPVLVAAANHVRPKLPVGTAAFDGRAYCGYDCPKDWGARRVAPAIAALGRALGGGVEVDADVAIACPSPTRCEVAGEPVALVKFSEVTFSDDDDATLVVSLTWEQADSKGTGELMTHVIRLELHRTRGRWEVVRETLLLQT